MLELGYRDSPWTDKELTFTRVASLLIRSRTQQFVALTKDDERRLREVSTVLYGALMWRRFTNMDERGSLLPKNASEAWRLLEDLRRETHLADLEPYWEYVGRAVNTLNAVTVGQCPEMQDIASASDLCRKIGDHIRVDLRSHDDED